jgi:hypothetical protein
MQKHMTSLFKVTHDQNIDNSTISLRNEISNYNANQSHHIITNNNNFAEYKTAFYFTIKIIPWPHARFGDVPRSVPRPALRAASRFPTVESSPVPPSQTLGVLFSPLSPPSRKGATQEPEIK